MALAFLPGLGSLFALPSAPRPALVTAVGFVLVVLEAAPLWWRRRYPLEVLIIVAAIPLIRILTGVTQNNSTAGVIFAVYAVSVYGSARSRLWVAGVTVVAVIVGVTLTLTSSTPVRSADVFSIAPISLVAWVLGDYMRSRRSFMSDMIERHRQEREKAAEDERLRIARELHDVVAHNVSAMAIQAGASRVAGGDAHDALASIERSARDTLFELNKLLGVLRRSGDAPLTPQPTLGDAETLLKPARDAGLDASLKVTGERRSLPPAEELSAYRIVQEAITNVLKHANATRVAVTIDYGADMVALTISDNGSGPNRAKSTGHGLIGMRERVELFGGDLSTGTSSLGGFVVRATLPVKA